MITAPGAAYEAAKNAWTLYGWFLQEAAADLGWDKAIAIQGRAGNRMAEVLTYMMRAQCGDSKPDPECISTVMNALFKNFGSDYEFQANDGGVTATYRRCPIYDGLAASGMEHAAIQNVCEAFQQHEYGKLQQAFPELTVTGKFRETADDSCVEEFVVAK